MITFNCLDADVEFTVRFRPGDDREQMDHDYDEVDTFGDDLDFGVTVGAFGAMGGGRPEVRMCSASVDTPDIDATSDEWCATFAYQWETGRCTARWAKSVATRWKSRPRPPVTARSGRR